MRTVVGLATALVCLSLAGHRVHAVTPESPPADHSRPMVYRSSEGQELPVRSAEDWAIRRRQILEGMEAVMGKLPDRSKLPAPECKVKGQIEGDRFCCLEIAYRVHGDEWVPAHLYLPKNRRPGQRVAAMVALHGTTPLGKRQLSGEPGAPPNRGYAVELAQRGYVVLAPDYPSFGDYPCNFRDSKWASGTMKGIFNHIRGVDLLIAREEVDPQRIGAIGHSLGGHNAMFLGVFDQRVKAVVASCGWTPFHDYYGGKLANWAQDRYMPRIRTHYALDPDRMPFDFDEVAAALAPRAFFSNSPLRDGNFDVMGVKKAEPRVRQIYALLGASDRIEIVYPDVGHDFPPEVRQAAYRFLDRSLANRP